MSQEDDKSENGDFKTLKPYWNCSFCTFENKTESFKCKMCHMRRGSSSRQAHCINPLLATQQYRPSGHQNPKKHHLMKPKDLTSKMKIQNVKVGCVGKRSRQTHAAKISNIDRKSGRSLAITVNNVTVNFTEYNLKAKQTTPPTKNKKHSMDLLPQCLVASEIDSSSKSSFTSQSESLLSYTDGASNEKLESNGIDQ